MQVFSIEIDAAWTAPWRPAWDAGDHNRLSVMNGAPFEYRSRIALIHWSGSNWVGLSVAELALPSPHSRSGNVLVEKCIITPNSRSCQIMRGRGDYDRHQLRATPQCWSEQSIA